MEPEVEEEEEEIEETLVGGGGVLYEIRRHATMDPPSEPPHSSGGSSSSGGLLSHLSFGGVNRLRQRWSEYRRPKASRKKSVSLFVSPDGEHVAVAAGSKITILQKDDDYMEPCGVFTCIDKERTFISGVWLEPLGVIGIIDDLNTLYFIRSNGMEITRRTRSQFKLSAPIIDLFVRKDVYSKNSCLCVIHAIAEDGLIHCIEITEEFNMSIYQSPAPSGGLHLPPKVACLDFHPDLSLAAIVCNSSMSGSSNDSSGNYSLYILRITEYSDVELLVCGDKLEGLFASHKGCLYDYSHPKVAISPQAKHVATLDFLGCVDVLKLDVEQQSLSLLSFTAKQQPEKAASMALGKKKYFFDIVDITWWTDDILILANMTGCIFMFDILNCLKVSENDPRFCMPLIERVKHGQGHAFLLENKSSVSDMSITPYMQHKTLQMREDSSGNYDKQDTDKSCWSLMSLFERSASEMYTILIKSHKYQSALEFASNHHFDTDEVFKAQWLDSSKGIPEINLYLSQVKDLMFVLSECVNRVGTTEEIVQALLYHGLCISDQHEFSDFVTSDCSSKWNIRMLRLQLLQLRDRLETFMGINMGRFSAPDYCKFRSKPLTEAAIVLAESSKIGALNLLFKRHPYSVSPKILDILASIPETVPIESYCQLLPGTSPPGTIALRDADWVECEEMLSFLNTLQSKQENRNQIFTENLLRLSTGYIWPSISELSLWYKNRSKDIDDLSGQLNNCLSLIEFGCRNGILELQQLLEDISYLHQIIYSDGFDEEFSMSLVTWEQLPDYEKFKIMLKGVKEDAIIKRLQETAIPFMQNRFSKASDLVDETRYGDRESFLVRWLKEIASLNQLDLCLAVIENGCGDSPVDGLFKDEVEIIETALCCIYSCSLTDQWNMMASILSKLPRNILRDNLFVADNNFSPRSNYEVENSKGSFVMYGLEGSTLDDSRRSDGKLDTDASIDKLEKRIKVAEGHIEVGRLMTYYQVPKPISFFLGAHSDEKNVKQLLRLILSKFSRRQPARSDNDWASMWRDLLSFQEKAFPFLDLEYILIEFTRGLLKAGKFSLARNYLKGTASVSLATTKAENLVIQAARDYFFSASSLSCSEIWKAKECLSLFPSSKAVKAEADMIDALTVRLPNLGVSLLPMQFRQIRNPMEIINMVITRQTGAYLNVEELVEIAKLLGLGSPDDIATVEEAVAREAAVAGDLPLAFDLCLVLAKKGHGSIWDLCAAIARGPNLDNMDQTSRKQLLGFALSHCDDESIGDLLNAWKEVDTHVQTEQLITLTGESPRNLFSSSLSENCTNEIFDQKDDGDLVEHGLYLDGVEVQHNQIKDALSKVGTDLVSEDGIRWDTILQENKKVLSFAASELPWLLELSEKEEYGKLSALEAKFSFIRHQVSMQMRALLCILCWMAGNNIIPHDDTIKSLAKSIMQPPTAEEDDILGCSFLLNLLDAFHGVDIIEDQLKRRNHYQEIYSIMNIGMAYSSLNNAHKKCSSPEKRRELLLQMFHNKQASFGSDEKDHIDKVQSTFWREWKSKLEEQKRLAEHARELEQIIPGIESARFLSRDMDYIKGVLFSFIDTIKLEKKHILKEAVKLADTYGLDRIEVILHFFACALVSEQWENNDILVEISEYRNDIVQCAKGVIDMIRTVVYPEIDGRNKQRLCYMYSILSACCLRLRRVEDLKPTTYQEGHVHILEPFQFYKVLEQECQRVSFIKDLNFKNIAGLDDLNFDHFNEEICNNIHENSVETLAVLVQSLVGIYDKSQAKGLITMEGVYKHHVLGLLASLEGRNEAKTDGVKADELQELLMEIEMNYDKCKMYVGALPEMNILYVFRRFLLVCFPHNFLRSLPEEPQWKECLIVLLTFWIKLVDDVPEKLTAIISGENPLYTATNNLLRCLKVFRRLVADDQISANQGWDTISNYVRHGLVDGLISDISSFLIAMIFSGCAFKSIAEACFEAVVSEISSRDSAVKYLLDIYINIVDKVLADLNMELDRHRNLHRMLSSLSRSAGNHEEDLKMIRLEVWEKLRAFSDNMQFASHTRLYSLQLMQCITGTNLKSLPAELISEVEPWEGWDESISMKATVTSEGADIPNSVTSTFVALKSTQIISAIFPDIEITPENMMTLDSAVSCFLHLSERITSAEHLSVLQVVLEEWEEFFSIKTDKEGTNESPKESNNWSSDEWDEGWEELVSAEAKQKGSVSIRPLHICWMEIIKRLIGFSELRLVMELLDKSSLKSDNVLLDEDEAQCLFQMVVGTDCFMALKLLLLLPYEATRSQCLRVLEDKLKRGSISDASSADNYDTLVLLLSSGLVRVIATDPSLCKVFSYICYLVGILARNSQDDMLNLLEVNGNRPKQKQPSPFISVLLPFFISELVCGGQPLMAGFIVSRWMHSHVCLSLIDVVEASLRRYLEQQILQVQDLVGHGYAPADDTSQSLMCSYSCLRSRLHNQLQSALLALTR